jgi:hypothetical protein
MDAPTTRRELVPVKEAAARLGLSESDVRRRIKAGTLPAEQFERPQGTYYRVIFEAPTDTSLPADQLPATRPNQTAPRPDAKTPRQHAAPGIDVLATLLARLTETVERQAQTIADLREDRGRLQAHAEHVSARAEGLQAELDALKAAQSPIAAPTAAQGPDLSTGASMPQPVPLWRRALSMLYGW